MIDRASGLELAVRSRYSCLRATGGARPAPLGRGCQSLAARSMPAASPGESGAPACAERMAYLLLFHPHPYCLARSGPPSSLGEDDGRLCTLVGFGNCSKTLTNTTAAFPDKCPLCHHFMPSILVIFGSQVSNDWANLFLQCQCQRPSIF